MTGTNHALTGAVIAGVIGVPILAAPVAFLSHFVLDSLPHFGEEVSPLTKFTKKVWLLDFIVLLVFLGFLVVTSNWLLLVGALFAILPDFAWVYRFVFKEKLGKIKPSKMNKLNSFHSSIQNYETKEGIAVEIVWFILSSTILYSFII
jgi:hypothetical protein